MLAGLPPNYLELAYLNNIAFYLYMYIRKFPAAKQMPKSPQKTMYIPALCAGVPANSNLDSHST